MNIYNIQQELLAIFDEIEENEGELTPELQEKLLIKETEFKDKVKAYSDAIKLYEKDINLIKEERKRLQDLSNKKQKVIDRLTKIIVYALENFGETKKSGVKYIDYGTGQISIHSSKSVEVNENLLNQIGYSIASSITFNKENNQLDVIDKLDIKPIMDFIQGDATEDDLRHTKLNISVNIPVSDIVDGNGYGIIKELAKYTDYYDINPIVSKTELKKELEENGSCAPHLAKFSINKSVQIK